MKDKKEKKSENVTNQTQPAGQVLPADKKDLKYEMPESVKSPMNELRDKKTITEEGKK